MTLSQPNYFLCRSWLRQRNYHENEGPMHKILMVLDLWVKLESDMFLIRFMKVTQAHMKPDITRLKLDIVDL